MKLLFVLLLVGWLTSPVLASDPVILDCAKDAGCGGTGGYKEGPQPGPDGGQVRTEPKVCPDGPFTPSFQGNEPEEGWGWFVVDPFGRRLSLPYEFRKACEPQVRALASAGAVRCAWVRR